MLLSHNKFVFTSKHLGEGYNAIYTILLERYGVTPVPNLGIGIFASKYLALKGLTAELKGD
jgi:hypothetical protein